MSRQPEIPGTAPVVGANLHFPIVQETNKLPIGGDIAKRVASGEDIYVAFDKASGAYVAQTAHENGQAALINAPEVWQQELFPSFHENCGTVVANNYTPADIGPDGKRR